MDGCTPPLVESSINFVMFSNEYVVHRTDIM